MERNVFTPLWRTLRILFLTGFLFTCYEGHAFEVEINGVLFASAGNGQVEVSKHSSGYSGDIHIPETITHEGTAYQVTAVGDSAFYKSSVTTVFLPEGLLEIGNSAFSQCSELLSVSLPSSLEEIGREAFYRCTKLSSINFPEGLKRINEQAFLFCEGLISLEFPSTLTHIGSVAFHGCTGLVSVSFSEGLKAIEHTTFDGCTSLNRVSLPRSLERIEQYAFASCISLDSIKTPSLTPPIVANNVFDNVPEGLLVETPLESFTTYMQHEVWGKMAILTAEGFFANGILYQAIKTDEAEITGLIERDIRELTIPQTVCAGGATYKITTIGEQAFFFCTELTSVSFPEGLEIIENGAFKDCMDLQAINLPSTVKRIGNNAFRGCTFLRSILLPASLESLGAGAFSSCHLLDNIHLLSVTPPALAEWTFEEHIYAEGIEVAEGALDAYLDHPIWRKFEVIRTGDLCRRKGISYRITGKDEAEVGENRFAGSEGIAIVPSFRCGGTTYRVTAVGNDAFYFSKIVSLYLPEGIIRIGEQAFYCCYDLQVVTLPKSLKQIDRFAFTGCYLLPSIQLPEGLEDLGNFAFSHCLKLTSMRIPEGIRSIGRGLFESCDKLEAVTLPAAIDSVGIYAFFCCRALKSLRFGEGLKFIGEKAFAGCENIQSIELPHSVTRIESSAFGSCSKLPSINWPSDLVYIGEYAFSYCSKLTSVSIPEGVNRLRNGTFVDCTGLRSVFLPAGLTHIEDYVFKGCRVLNTITASSLLPASLLESSFEADAYDRAVLFVPEEAEEAYITHPVWRLFANIRTSYPNSTDRIPENSVTCLSSPGTGVLIVNSMCSQQEELYDVTGKFFRKLLLQPGENIVTGLPSGIYFIQGKKVQVQ